MRLLRLSAFASRSLRGTCFVTSAAAAARAPSLPLLLAPCEALLEEQRWVGLAGASSKATLLVKDATLLVNETTLLVKEPTLLDGRLWTGLAGRSSEATLLVKEAILLPSPGG